MAQLYFRKMTYIDRLPSRHRRYDPQELRAQVALDRFPYSPIQIQSWIAAEGQRVDRAEARRQ